eukprot:jgi/Chlat1/4620/Chrsp3S05586
MYSNFKEQAIEYVKQAVAEDQAGRYDKALPLYMNALEYFRTHLKYEKNPRIKEAITNKFREYLSRAEEIKALLDNGPVRNAPAADGTGLARGNGNGKGGGGGGGGGDDGGENAKLRGALGSAIVTEKPNVRWEDVAGLDSAKEALKEAVILPVKYPQFFTGKRKPWKGFLLYGPPGTGKSYLAKAVATEADSTFFSVKSSDLVSKWMGESERLVANLFQMAREKSPAIIFIDEVDSLCSSRGDSESEAARRIKTEFLVQMQGVGNDNDSKVLVLAATNLPYSLDQAMRRRFDKRIYIPLPDETARSYMFKVHLGVNSKDPTPNELREQDFIELGRRTEGFSGSDIDHVVKDVLFEPVRKVQDATHFKRIRGADGPEMYVPCAPTDPAGREDTLATLTEKDLANRVMVPKITMSDFEKVLARARPTVSHKDLELHDRFTQEFGEEG